MSKLQTRFCGEEQDIRAFFEETAVEYQEMHGNPDKLLQYRMNLVTSHADLNRSKTLLDLGCGNGHHLFYLSNQIKQGIGIDFSETMIQKALELKTRLKEVGHLEFRVDRAQELGSVPDKSVDVVMCVGSFEHMLKKPLVVSQVYRILKHNGCFILLTPNGSYLWYRWFAPLLGMDTRHLSTDQFLNKTELKRMLEDENFIIRFAGNWTFIPRGDMRNWQAAFLKILDWKGRLFRLGFLRGGIIIRADKMG